MVGTIQKLIQPTGYEAEQRRAQREQDLADQFQQQSQDTSGIQSWAQVLAKVGAALAASRLRNKSDALDTDVTNKITSAFANHRAAFQKDVAGGMSNTDLVNKWGGDQFVASDVKPYADAMAEALKNREALKDTGLGLKRAGDILNTGPIPDMNKDVIPIGRNQDGGVRFGLNPLKLAGSQLSQMIPSDNDSARALEGLQFNVPSSLAPAGNTPPPIQPQPAAPAPSGGVPFTPSNIGQVESGNQDFLSSGQPVTSPKGAMYGMQVMPSTAAQPGYGVPPVPASIMNLPATDPRRAAAFDNVGKLYAAAMAKRFGALGPAAYNAGPGRVQSAGGNLSALPQETQQYSAHFAPPSVPTSSTRPPDAQTKDGRPVWYVNGVPFDNPEGN